MMIRNLNYFPFAGFLRCGILSDLLAHISLGNKERGVFKYDSMQKLLIPSLIRLLEKSFILEANSGPINLHPNMLATSHSD